MRRWTFVLALAVLLGLGAVVAFAGPGPRPGSASAGRPLFDDEFSGHHLDRRHWSTCYWWGERGCTIASNHELEWYQPGQVTVDGGVARLVAKRRSVAGSDGRRHPFVSGMISSGPAPGHGKAAFAFRYGRLEARIRMPAGRGLWPALWLLPASRSSLPEIDVMEVVGLAPSLLQMHLHTRGPHGTERVWGQDLHDGGLTAGWHVFGIEWRPGRLAWLLDGRVVWRLAGGQVPDVPMYPIVDLAVGGILGGPVAPHARLNGTLEVDWLRVWR